MPQQQQAYWGWALPRIGGGFIHSFVPKIEVRWRKFRRERIGRKGGVLDLASSMGRLVRKKQCELGYMIFLGLASSHAKQKYNQDTMMNRR